MRTQWIILSLSFLLNSALAEDIVFKKKGVVVKSYTLADFKKEFPVETLTVREGHEDNNNVTYRGTALKNVMQKVYGGKVDQDELLFTCSDGYKPSVPLQKSLKHHTFLAYEKVEGAFEFTDKASGKVIQYGPLYLIWENIKDPEIKLEGLEFWPYQVVDVDLISFQERFKALIPKAKMSDPAKRGFVAYRTHCIQCHRINGEGGDKGIELNYPASVTEYFKPAWLKKFIVSPQEVRMGSAMPPFDKNYPNYSKKIDDIIEYLKAISGTKIAPK